MDTETTNKMPILEIAWTRFAVLDAAAIRRTRGFYRIRKFILGLAVTATAFAILTTSFFSDSESLLGLIVKIFFIATPIIASIFAAFATRFYSNGSWLVIRAGAEEIKKEIYLHRTVRKNKPKRGEILEKKLAGIQRQMFRSLGGEFSFEPYDGKVPPYFTPKTSEEEKDQGDPGYHDLNGDEYFKYRLEHQFSWHNNKINGYKAKRRMMVIYILLMGGLGALLAALGGGLSLLVALTASITAALIGWQELNNYDTVIRNYSKVVMELTILYDHWLNLKPEDRTEKEFHNMVEECEKVLWEQNVEYIRSMQEVLKEEDLEEEAKLATDLVARAVETDKNIKQEISEAVLETAGAALDTAQEKIVEEFKETLGTLVEEASSELVQQELEAMKKAVAETAQTVMARVSSLNATLSQLAEEYSGVDIGRDTTKEELNAILARYPKTTDVKG